MAGRGRREAASAPSFANYGMASQAALDGYATHPEHLRVKGELEGLRIARHQVDYEVKER